MKTEKDKKIKLYDFTIFTATSVLISYAMLLTLFLYMGFTNEKNGFVGFIIAGLLFLSLGMILWMFAYMAPYLDKKGAHHGKKVISIYNIKFRNDYNMRFREEQIIIEDKLVKYEKLEKKEIDKIVIKVQNTKANIRKVNEYCKIFDIKY